MTDPKENSDVLGTRFAQHHDDRFIIEYARRSSGFVVSNDMFRDHVEEEDNDEIREVLRCESSRCRHTCEIGIVSSLKTAISPDGRFNSFFKPICPCSDWIRTHVISFAFVGSSDFVPFPDLAEAARMTPSPVSYMPSRALLDDELPRADDGGGRDTLLWPPENGSSTGAYWSGDSGGPPVSTAGLVPAAAATRPGHRAQAASVAEDDSDEEQEPARTKKSLPLLLARDDTACSTAPRPFVAREGEQQPSSTGSWAGRGLEALRSRFPAAARAVERGKPVVEETTRIMARGQLRRRGLSPGPEVEREVVMDVLRDYWSSAIPFLQEAEQMGSIFGADFRDLLLDQRRQKWLRDRVQHALDAAKLFGP